MYSVYLLVKAREVAQLFGLHLHLRLIYSTSTIGSRGPISNYRLWGGGWGLTEIWLRYNSIYLTSPKVL